MMTIGQISKAAGVPASTVRYYEREGLMQASARSEGNYRLFAPADLDRLRFIRAAQSAGFTLDDVEDLLHLRDTRTSPCGEVKSLIETRLQEVENRLNDLASLSKSLSSFLGRCEAADASDPCEVIEMLDADSNS